LTPRRPLASLTATNFKQFVRPSKLHAREKGRA
jgi:hypothetical protein